MYEGIEIFEIFWNSLILLNIDGGGVIMKAIK
jgi:hypothetical protein